MPPGFVDGRYYHLPGARSSNLGDHGAPLADDVLRSGDGTPRLGPPSRTHPPCPTRIAIEKNSTPEAEADAGVIMHHHRCGPVMCCQSPHSAQDRDGSVFPAMMPARSPPKGWSLGKLRLPSLSPYSCHSQVGKGLRRAEGNLLYMLRCMRWRFLHIWCRCKFLKNLTNRKTFRRQGPSSREDKSTIRVRVSPLSISEVPPRRGVNSWDTSQHQNFGGVKFVNSIPTCKRYLKSSRAQRATLLISQGQFSLLFHLVAGGEQFHASAEPNLKIQNSDSPSKHQESTRLSELHQSTTPQTRRRPHPQPPS
jgi:hypothetical protein